MSTLSIDRLPPEIREHPPITTVLDDRRGTAAMWLLVLTEGTLFVLLFFSYFYLAQGGYRWPHEAAPKLTLALVMLVVLWASSVVLYWGESQVKLCRYGRGRLALGITILMGFGFLAIQGYEYMDHLKDLKPTDNVYGSIFYTITTFHAAHLILGLTMLIYVMLLPRWEPVDRPPHRPFHNAAIYWHFVDFVWLWIVIFLYIMPNTR